MNEELKEQINIDPAGDESKEIDTSEERINEGLAPEHIGHLLEVLGEDVIISMLHDAGMTDDDLMQASPVTMDDTMSASESDIADPAEGKPSGLKRRHIGRPSRRYLLLAIFAGIILLVFAVNQISMNVTLNNDDPIQYSEQTDDISALEGLLKVNDISVSVPTDGTEEYNISYSWAEYDDKYPSVPQAITAEYSDKEGEKLYTISLYRSETIPKKEVPKGKNADNWFDGWETVSEGDVIQKPLKSGNINGFYIYPQLSEDGAGTLTDYNNYSYYFAVKDNGGISIYILEGVCLDKESSALFPVIMDDCIKNITIQKEKKTSDTQEA